MSKVVAFYADRPYIYACGDLNEIINRIYTDSDLCCFKSLYHFSPRLKKWRLLSKRSIIPNFNDYLNVIANTIIYCLGR